ncbi:MAG TPA: hypothetical protein VFE27_08675 [Acidobacteriaceae bacterium]|nr:hypothetical protein [Acidobacteriaceae bacterium]
MHETRPGRTAQRGNIPDNLLPGFGLNTLTTHITHPFRRTYGLSNSLPGGFKAHRAHKAHTSPQRALPLTAAIDALRGNMLQGMNLGQLTLQMAILLTWLMVSFALALRIFRWR